MTEEQQVQPGSPLNEANDGEGRDGQQGRSGRGRAGSLLRNGFLHNVIALYGVQACTYALPLLTFPYLAHVLGPSGWGAVVFAQAIGVVIASVVEYGFDISASRETSRQRHHPRRLATLIAGVLGAKMLLSLVCVGGAILSRPFTQHVAPSPALFWASTIWGICQGINMLWFFQGLERMRLASALEISGKVLATLSIFVLVHRPEDGWKVMAAQCVGCVISHGVTVLLAYREVGFEWPTFASVSEALRLGGSMFLFRAVQGLSGSANRLVLGAVAPVAALGEYAGAERLVRVFQQGLWPVNQALYPKLSHQTNADPAGAATVVRRSLFWLGAVGVVFGLMIFFTAPIMVRMILGPDYGAAIPVLQVFSLWIPLTALVTVFTFQVLLPHRLDGAFNLVNLTAGLFGIVAALLLAPRFHAVGIAWSAVATQVYTLLAFFVIVVRAQLNPYRRTAAQQPRPPRPALLVPASRRRIS